MFLVVLLQFLFLFVVALQSCLKGFIQFLEDSTFARLWWAYCLLFLPRCKPSLVLCKLTIAKQNGRIEWFHQVKIMMEIIPKLLLLPLPLLHRKEVRTKIQWSSLLSRKLNIDHCFTYGEKPNKVYDSNKIMLSYLTTLYLARFLQEDSSMVDEAT